MKKKARTTTKKTTKPSTKASGYVHSLKILEIIKEESTDEDEPPIPSYSNIKLAHKDWFWLVMMAEVGLAELRKSQSPTPQNEVMVREWNQLISDVASQV